jgi:hypothetical protein
MSNEAATLDLYGVRVPAASYEVLKRLTLILTSQTKVGVPLQQAHRACLLMAMRVLSEARNLGGL